MELPKRIDRFCSKSCIRSSWLLHRCFSEKTGVAFRNSSSNEATELFPRDPPRLRSSSRSATNWVLSATSIHRMVAITVKEADTVPRFRNFLKPVIGFYPPTQILMFYGLRIIPYIYGRPLKLYGVMILCVCVFFFFVKGLWYFFSKFPSACEDFNECEGMNNNCDTNAVCMNSLGTFSCRCNSGFRGDGTSGNCHGETFSLFSIVADDRLDFQSPIKLPR